MPTVAKHSLVAFFLLAYAISWSLWLPAAAWQGALPAPAPLVLVFLGSFGPTLAAILLTAATGGRPGLRDLLGRLRLWRVGPLAYLPVLLGPAVVVLCAVGLHALLGGAAPGFSDQVPAGLPLYVVLPALVPIFLLGLVFGGPLGEEIGWRGYALPRLQTGRSPLRASLILGALWGDWHLPLFWIAGISQAAMPLLPFLLWTVALSICFTQVYDHTRGSLLIAVLFHHAVNFPAGLLILPAGASGAVRPFLLYVELVCAVAVAVTITSWPARRSLGGAPAPARP